MLPFLFLWMVQVKTKIQEQKEALAESARRTPQRKTRTTRVRTRCSAETPDEMVAEVAAAMPQIVRATVKRAQAGSLPHAKWLWVIASAAKDTTVERKGKAQSLSAMLAEQLEKAL